MSVFRIEIKPGNKEGVLALAEEWRVSPTAVVNLLLSEILAQKGKGSPAAPATSAPVPAPAAGNAVSTIKKTGLRASMQKAMQQAE